jgi:citrate/tricarballylate utilization protein
MPPTDLTVEGQRIFRICNSCRYCEGFCAVYPAMERRTAFPSGDLNYLANLCHNCGECYDACQYAPPHEFAVNVPLLLAKLRAQSYQQYAWPQLFARAYRSNGLVVSVLLVLCVAAAILLLPHTTPAPSDFYGVLPHDVMAAIFGAAAAYTCLAFAIGFVRFWRDTGEKTPLHPAAIAQCIKDVFTLRYLGNRSRRWLHHLTFYGFLLCFASTSTAAIYHYVFDWQAPYGYLTLPVILGTLGGLSLLGGVAGLFFLKLRRNPATQDSAQFGMDTGFLALLFLSSFTGLLLLGLRETTSMPTLLGLHLGVILALFLTLPYGKFVHGIYRTAALLRNALERDSKK